MQGRLIQVNTRRKEDNQQSKSILTNQTHNLISLPAYFSALLSNLSVSQQCILKI